MISVKHFAPWPHPLGRKRGQRLVDDVEKLQEIGLVGLYIKDAGRELAAPGRLVNRPDSVESVGGVVILGHLLQIELRTVVHLAPAVVVPGSYSTEMSSKNGTKLTSPSGSS